jgi:hypothetical protein
MTDRKDVWKRVTDAGPEMSWIALTTVLLFLSSLLAFQGFMVFTARTHRADSIISVFLLPLGVLHTGAAIVRKLRRGLAGRG